MATPRLSCPICTASWYLNRWQLDSPLWFHFKKQKSVALCLTGNGCITGKMLSPSWPKWWCKIVMDWPLVQGSSYLSDDDLNLVVTMCWMDGVTRFGVCPFNLSFNVPEGNLNKHKHLKPYGAQEVSIEFSAILKPLLASSNRLYFPQRNIIPVIAYTPNKVLGALQQLVLQYRRVLT